MTEIQKIAITEMEAERDRLRDQYMELRNDVLDMYNDKKVSQYYALHALVRAHMDGLEAEISTIKTWIHNFNSEADYK